MKPARKTKDFSIESILADKRVYAGNERDEWDSQPASFENRADVQVDKHQESGLEINTGHRFSISSDNPEKKCEKQYKTNESRINHGSCERENRDVNVRGKTEVNIKEQNKLNFKRNYEELTDKLRGNSLGSKKFKYNSNENKLQMDIVNDFTEIVDASYKCTSDSKSTFTTELGDRNREVDGTVLTSFVPKKLNLNQRNTVETGRYVQEACKQNSKKFNFEKIDINCAEAGETNHSKTVTPNKECEGNARKNTGSGQNEQFNAERKIQLTTDQSDTFYNSRMKYTVKNCSNPSENQYKDLKDNFNRNFETPENKDVLFERECSRNRPGKSEVVIRDVQKLEWLQCTRYKPPKIPRKPTYSRNKRKPSFYPRIPFSVFQLDFLEQKFQRSAYLSRNDVLDISNILKLPPNRIKIWFQNRRARERREICTSI